MICGSIPAASRVSIAGSYRRRKEIVRDLDFIVATKAPEEITEFFVGHPLVESVIARGATKTSVRLRSGIQADLRVVSSSGISRLRSVILPGARSTTSSCGTARCNAAGP